MKRDFSQEKLEELWDFVNDSTSEYLKNMGKIVDLEELDIAEAAVCTMAIQTFQKKLEEKEIMTANKLVEIIKNVKEVDETFGRYLKTLNEQMAAYNRRVQAVTEMLKPDKLSMNSLSYLKELLAMGKEYQCAKENGELIKVELWLNPGYKLEGAELEDAQEVLDRYFAEGTDAWRRYFSDEYCPVDESAYDEWTEEDWRRYQLMSALYEKLDEGTCFCTGMTKGVPFAGGYRNWSLGVNAWYHGYEVEEVYRSDSVFANSHVQHPYITFGGDVTGSLLTYYMAASAAGSIPGLSRRISSLSGRLSTFPILRSIGQDHLTNIIGATFIETGISTFPGMVSDIWNGEGADTVFRNAGLDIGRNLLFNIGGEAISGVVGAVLKRVTGGRKAVTEAVGESIDDVAEAAVRSGNGTINGLEVIDGKVDGKIPLAAYEKYRVDSVHNPNSDIMTLGKYEPTIRADGTKDFSIPGADAYTVKAENTTYFSLGTEWDNITETYGLDKAGKNMFDYFNKPALDDAVKAGKEIRFSHDPEAYGECALKWEWDYLQEKYGYFALEKRGDFWYAAK